MSSDPAAPFYETALGRAHLTESLGFLRAMPAASVDLVLGWWQQRRPFSDG